VLGQAFARPNTDVHWPASISCSRGASRALMKFMRIALEVALGLALFVCGAMLYGNNGKVQSPFLPHFGFSLDASAGTLNVQGTRTLIGDEIANPIQSTSMECRRSLKACIEATAEIAGDLLRPISVNTLEIERWDQDFIVVRGRGCRVLKSTTRSTCAHKSLPDWRQDHQAAKSLENGPGGCGWSMAMMRVGFGGG
jgi:hypothetical protein